MGFSPDSIRMAGMASNTAPRSAPQLKQPRNPISRKQVEVVISRSVASSGFVFGAQSVSALIAQAHEVNPIWLVTVVVSLFASFVVAIVLSIIQRRVRLGHAIVAGVYVLSLITWPIATIHPHTGVDNTWLYLLLTVGTATASIAFSTRVATIYLFAVPALYGILRTTHNGGGVPPPLAILDSIYAIILGAAIMIIVTMLRQAAANVDQAQGTALDRYGHAVRQHATEVERVQVDSIVHDSVLTTLLSAARAFTPEAMDLSAVMASNAIGHLHDAALVQPDDGTTVRLRAVAKRIVESAKGMSVPFEVRVTDVGSRAIPVSAAEAVHSAAVQAMVNSIQHAGGENVSRWVSLRGVRPGGIEVVVGDTGGGFSVNAVPTERLGVRVSIIERIANSGGSAEIASSPAEGTLVTLRWPTLDEPAPDPSEAIASELLGASSPGSMDGRGRGRDGA
jgi:two-component sensor histidine kinase